MRLGGAFHLLIPFADRNLPGSGGTRRGEPWTQAPGRRPARPARPAPPGGATPLAQDGAARPQAPSQDGGGAPGAATSPRWRSEAADLAKMAASAPPRPGAAQAGSGAARCGAGLVRSGRSGRTGGGAGPGGRHAGAGGGPGGRAPAGAAQRRRSLQQVGHGRGRTLAALSHGPGRAQEGPGAGRGAGRETWRQLDGAGVSLCRGGERRTQLCAGRWGPPSGGGCGSTACRSHRSGRPPLPPVLLGEAGRRAGSSRDSGASARSSASGGWGTTSCSLKQGQSRSGVCSYRCSGLSGVQMPSLQTPSVVCA